MPARSLFVSLGFSAMLAAGPAMAESVWHIKCLASHGETLSVKAFDDSGATFDIKALKEDNDDLLHIKALNHLSDGELHVKVLPNPEVAEYSDVKAITDDHEVLSIKGLTDNGDKLDIKAFLNEEDGVFDIKCLEDDGTRLGLKAISPSGTVFDVKGLAEHEGADELEIEIEAHIKAIPQG